MVYVLECEDSIKVGIATSITKRIASLQTGNPKRLYLLHCLPGDRRIERALHRRLRKARGLGEWFAGSEVKDFLKWIEAECDKAVAHFEQHGTKPPPCIPPAEPRPVGMTRSGSIRQIQHRWQVAYHGWQGQSRSRTPHGRCRLNNLPRAAQRQALAIG